MKALKTKILWQIHCWVSGSGLFGGLGSREHCGLCLATIWFWSDQSNFAIWPYGQNSRLGRKWKYCKIQNIGVGISFKCVAAVLISWRMIAAAKTHLLLLFMLFLLYVEHPTIFSNTLYAFLDALHTDSHPTTYSFTVHLVFRQVWSFKLTIYLAVCLALLIKPSWLFSIDFSFFAAAAHCSVGAQLHLCPR